MTQALWYASRATGLVSLVLLTATTVLGIMNGARRTVRSLPRFATVTLHRNATLLALVFLAVHVASAIVDPYAGIRWADAVVPFVSPYQPMWLGLGAVALDLVIALTVTSLLRPLVGVRLWRGLHWFAYGCWALAVVHGVGIGGADSRRGWVLALELACVVAVAVATVVRVASTHPDTEARRERVPSR
jgi:DMSO/TMAO reductase YedYZ heme-binding membrane subunit